MKLDLLLVSFSVLYFSWHRYEHQEFWPSLKESDYDAVGLGKGKGFNINLPWNKVNVAYSTIKEMQSFISHALGNTF